MGEAGPAVLVRARVDGPCRHRSRSPSRLAHPRGADGDDRSVQDRRLDRQRRRTDRALGADRRRRCRPAVPEGTRDDGGRSTPAPCACRRDRGALASLDRGHGGPRRVAARCRAFPQGTPRHSEQGSASALPGAGKPSTREAMNIDIVSSTPMLMGPRCLGRSQGGRMVRRFGAVAMAVVLLVELPPCERQARRDPRRPRCTHKGSC